MHPRSREVFFEMVRNYIATDPEAAAHMIPFVAEGIEQSRKEALHRAADMECALSVSLAPRYPNKLDFILSKLEKWNGKSALRWDDTIATLVKKVLK